MLVCKPSEFRVLRISSSACITKTKDIKGLLSSVCLVFCVSDEAIKSKIKTRELADARKCFHYLGFRYLDVNKIDLSREVNQDHATGIYSIKSCRDLMKHDKVFAAKVSKVSQLYFLNHPQILN